MKMLILNILQTLLLIAIAPLATGILRKLKARLQNRRGPGILQPYRDMAKLFSKETVIAENASWLFRFAPYVVFTATLAAAFVVPVFFLAPPKFFIVDIIALAALLALARFFLALAGMDIGTAFGGMGASREMTFAALAEPAMLMSVFVIAIGAHSTNISVMINFTLNLHQLVPSFAFALAAMLMVAIAENGRIPIDNPATHLELTMIHEAMLLEYSGKNLALIEWASQIKLLIFATLIVDLFFPWGIANGLHLSMMLPAILVWAAKVMLLFMMLAVVESGMAKMQLFNVPDYLFTAFVLSFIGMLIYYVLEVGA